MKDKESYSGIESEYKPAHSTHNTNRLPIGIFLHNKNIAIVDVFM